MSSDAPTSINKLKGVPFMGPLSKRVPGTSGNIYFVSSGHLQAKDDPMWGSRPNKPFATIDYAIGQCTASQGDTILVMPGHTEDCTAPGSIEIDVAGVHVIGLGHGRNRPAITFSTLTTASFKVSGANVTVENLYFNAASCATLTGVVNIAAADCIMGDCEFLCADATNQAVNVLVTAAGADRFILEDCRFLAATADAGLVSCVLVVGGDGIIIRRNLIAVYASTDTGCIENTTTDTTNIWIDGNVLDNRTAISTAVVTLTATSTGWITNNRVAVLSGTAPFVSTALFGIGGNYYTAAAGVTAGTLA